MSNESESRLLTPQERAICRQIAAGDAPHSQRAAVLLALDEGATQAEAGEHAGLSRGQLQYWLSKFQQQRLNIFPDGLLHVYAVPTSAPPETFPEQALQPLSAGESEAEPKEEPAEVQSVEDAGKTEKAKGGKRKAAKKAKDTARPVKDRVKAKKAKGGKEKATKKAKKKPKKAKGGKEKGAKKAKKKAKKAIGRKKEAARKKSQKAKGGKG